MTEDRSAFTEAIDGAVDALRGVGRIGKALGSALGLPLLGRHHHKTRPGVAAGIEHAFDLSVPPEPGAVRITCLDYDADRAEERAIEDIQAFLEEARPPWARVRWINVDGLHPQVVDRFRNKLGFHSLSAEDVLHVPQRPRLEEYDDHIFITTRMIGLDAKGLLLSEQISMFLYEDVLLTFQQFKGDVFDPIRQRIRADGARLRNRDASFLAYSLLDAMIDQGFPLMERYGELIEDLEETAMEEAVPDLLQRIQCLKRELMRLRRIMWPTRELIDNLMRHERLPDVTRTYLRDVYTHSVQLIDVLETHREATSGLVELYMSVVSNRMNEVMKVLTIIATLFIPITFLAGVYGMNFKHFPELDWRYAYPAFWGICALITAGLIWYFRRKRWF